MHESAQRVPCSDFISNLSGHKLKLGQIDCAGFSYVNHDYLLCHDDHLESRRVAYVMHFGKNFMKEDGGALCLFNSDNLYGPKNVVKRILPHTNSLVLFTVSNISHHQVEEILSSKQRLTIAGWFHG